MALMVTLKPQRKSTEQRMADQTPILKIELMLKSYRMCSVGFFSFSSRCNCRCHRYAIFMTFPKRLPTFFAVTKRHSNRFPLSPLNCDRNWHWTMCHSRQMVLNIFRCIDWPIVAMLWRRDVKGTESLSSHQFSDANWKYFPSRRTLGRIVVAFALFVSTKAALNHLMQWAPHTHSKCFDHLPFTMWWLHHFPSLTQRIQVFIDFYYVSIQCSFRIPIDRANWNGEHYRPLSLQPQQSVATTYPL